MWNICARNTIRLPLVSFISSHFIVQFFFRISCFLFHFRRSFNRVFRKTNAHNKVLLIHIAFVVHCASCAMHFSRICCCPFNAYKFGKAHLFLRTETHSCLSVLNYIYKITSLRELKFDWPLMFLCKWRRNDFQRVVFGQTNEWMNEWNGWHKTRHRMSEYIRFDNER